MTISTLENIVKRFILGGGGGFMPLYIESKPSPYYEFICCTHIFLPNLYSTGPKHYYNVSILYDYYS